VNPIRDDALMTLKLENPNGQAICSVEDWLSLAHPPDAAAEWKDFHSAKELARAYFRADSPSVPQEMTTLLDSRPETQGVQIDDAVAGKNIVAGAHWAKKRHSDLLLYGHRGQEKIVIAVEAVADQPFGDNIDEALMHGTPDNPRPSLIHDLSRAVFGRAIDAQLHRLRYQLLHGLAATIIEAENQQATFAAFVVQEFLSLTLNFDHLMRNHEDLIDFIHSVPGWHGERLSCGMLLPPTTARGEMGLPSDIPFSLGLIRTLLPLDSGGRQRPAAGMQANRQYLAR
jgi:hypothetical protein